MNRPFYIISGVIFWLFTLLGIACGSNSDIYTPPSLDENDGVLVATDNGTEQLTKYLPELLLVPVVKLADETQKSQVYIEQLCSFAPDVDTLYRFYQWKLFNEKIFEDCNGVWAADSLARNLTYFDSAFGLSRRDSASVFKDSTFVANYSSFLTAAEALATSWQLVIASSQYVSSICVLWRLQTPLLCCSNLEIPGTPDANELEMFSDIFIKDYGWRTLPANYENQVANGKHVYIRYFATTIVVTFFEGSGGQMPLYDIEMVFRYPCNVE